MHLAKHDTEESTGKDAKNNRISVYVFSQWQQKCGHNPEMVKADCRLIRAKFFPYLSASAIALSCETVV